jgi:hypothetical protein
MAMRAIVHRGRDIDLFFHRIAMLFFVVLRCIQVGTPNVVGSSKTGT